MIVRRAREADLEAAAYVIAAVAPEDFLGAIITAGATAVFAAR